MSKLKNIIKQLSEKDYLAVYESLMDCNADKSASLLKFLKEKQLSDVKIMAELDVNSNAYYTLRSRLNEKIEEYLVKEMDSPKTDVLRKVSNVNDLLFTKKRTLIVATLKKLEKELVDYDLSNELIIVYKNLKKLHIGTPEHYYYSQLYNKHVAYMLASDKAEDILVNYFKKYGQYFLSQDSTIRAEILMLKNEIINIAQLYQSHRLYVYQCFLTIFHHIFVDFNLEVGENEETVVQSFDKIDTIFETYSTDPNYHHLKIVIEFLKLEYYNSINLPRKAEKYYADVNDFANVFLSNYSLYTFPASFLLSKIQRIIDKDSSVDALEENKVIFTDFDCEVDDLPKFTIYHTYRALCYHFAGKNDQAAKIIHNLLNETTLKKYAEVQLEIKTFLALQYCLMNDEDLFNQLMNSIQRQIRISGKKKLEHVVLLTKVMKLTMGGAAKTKTSKLKLLVNKISFSKVAYFTPLRYIKYDEIFI